MLQAGLAHADITPPVGTRLSGFAGRPTESFASTGVRDPLRASVLWLAEGDCSAVIVALDTIGLSVVDDAKWRLALSTSLGCPPEAIFLSCSHTHSGACTMTIRATGEKEEAWTQALFALVLDAAMRAKAEAQPVTSATSGSMPCEASVNRRHPDGPRDPLVRSLSLHTTTGPLVTVFHFACHPVALGNQNTELSADWVSTARKNAEAHLGNTTLFLQGCCGDINPLFMAGPRSPEQAKRIGAEVGVGICRAVFLDRPIELTPIGFGTVTVELPLRPYPAEAVLLEVEADAQAKLQRGRSDVDQAYLEWATAVRSKPESPHVLATVSALRLGQITLVGLPGEIFAELGLALEGTWPVGFTNGNLGYLYPDSAMEVGGYEVDVAYRLYGEQALAPGAAEALLDGARRAILLAQSM